MTGRERLLAATSWKPVDRIPVSPFIHNNFVKAFFDSHEIDLQAKTVEVYDYFGFDIIHRNCTPAYDTTDRSGDGWSLERETRKAGRDVIRTSIVHTPEGDLTETFRQVWVSEYDAEATPVEYLIKTHKDFDLLVKYQPIEAATDTSPISRARDFVGERGFVAPWMQGAFNHVAFYYRPLEELLLDALTDSGFYHQMMEHFLSHAMEIASQYIDAGADALSYAANIASGNMVSEAFFREFILPYEKRLVEFIQSKGALVIYHNCGYARNLFSCYREIEMKIYESLAAPPYGDTLLVDAFESLGTRSALCGGIDQVDFLRTASPDEIRAEVQDVLDQAVPRGGFILATTDYLNEDTPLENVRTFAEAGIGY